ELGRLMLETPRLAASGLPASPTQFLQVPRRGESWPLVAYLCRVWLEAGLHDKEWQQALSTYEEQLKNQPGRDLKDMELVHLPLPEVRWTLETFSIWVMSRGRRLRECSHWFRAFDFDRDEMVGVADFIQGIVAGANASRMAHQGSGGLLSALSLFRLLDLEQERLK
ncbi:unnamed protein product, partial [Polarella glacialis]